MDVLLIQNDQTIRVNGLQDEVTESYLNAATVTVTLKAKDGTEVAGETWPLTLSYVAASDGNYIGNLSDELELTAGRTYFVEITAVSGEWKGFWRFPRAAEYRQP